MEGSRRERLKRQCGAVDADDGGGGRIRWLLEASSPASHGAVAESARERGDRDGNVRTAQFGTILNESSLIIIQMRVNTCLPESVPHVIPHLETRITDTSFIQNNIKSGSPGMCSNIRPGFSICTYRLQSDTSPQNHKEQFFLLQKFNIGSI